MEWRVWIGSGPIGFYEICPSQFTTNPPLLRHIIVFHANRQSDKKTNYFLSLYLAYWTYRHTTVLLFH